MATFLRFDAMLSQRTGFLKILVRYACISCFLVDSFAKKSGLKEINLKTVILLAAPQEFCKYFVKLASMSRLQ